MKIRVEQMTLSVNRFIHNVFIHPVIQFLPKGLDKKFHNWHSNMTWGESNKDIWEGVEEIKKRYCSKED